MKTTVHKRYFWKQFESKYSLLDGFVHFSTFRLTLRELVLSVQNSHCLKTQCSEPFLSAGSVIYPRQWSIPLCQPTEIRFGGTVVMEFSQYRYISTVAFRSTSRSDVTIRSKSITISRPMNCVARKMWGIHDAVRAHKARRHFRFSLTSIPSIPKRDL